MGARARRGRTTAEGRIPLRCAQRRQSEMPRTLDGNFQFPLLLLRSTGRIDVLPTREEGWQSDRGRRTVLAVLLVRYYPVDRDIERYGGIFHSLGSEYQAGEIFFS